MKTSPSRKFGSECVLRAVERLEPRRLLAVLINATGGDDAIDIDLRSDGVTIDIDINGNISTRNVGSETLVRVSAFAGNDIINIVDMAGLDLEVLGAAGDDTLTMGSGNGTSLKFLATTLDGGTGNDVLVFDDFEISSANPNETHDYEFEAGTMRSIKDFIVGGDITVPHEYSFETVTVNSGFASGTFSVASLGIEGNLTLNGGGGADGLILTPFPTTSTIHFDGQAEEAQIPPLPPIPNGVTIDDSAAAGPGASYTLDAGTFDMPGFGLLQFTAARKVELRTRNAGSDVDVLGVASTASTTITGGAGDDLITIGDGDYDTNILAAVSVVGGGGQDLLSIDDSTDGGNDGYELFGNLFVKSNMTFGLNFSIEELSLIGSAASNAFEVRPGQQTRFNLAGRNPLTLPGDSLAFQSAEIAGSASYSAGTYSFENAQDLNISGIEMFPLPPPAPSTPDLRPEDDTGFSFTDNVTNVSQPTFNGTAPASASVVLFDGTTQIGQTTASGTGAWSVLADVLADGTHPIAAVVRGAGGLTGPKSSPVNLTIDTVAPTTPAAAPDLATNSDTGLSITDDITRDNTPQFDGSVPINEIVRLFVDGVLIASDTTTPTGTYSIVTPALTDGVRQVVARFEDLAGNQSGFSPTRNVTIDTIAPAAPTVAPDMTAASDTGVSSSDNITRDATPTFTGTRPANTAVLILQGSDIFGQDLTTAPTTYTVTTSSIIDGAYNLAAMFRDIAGNDSGSGPGLPITIDTLAPALTNSAFNFLTSQNLQFTFSENVGGGIGLNNFALKDVTHNASIPNASLAMAYSPNTATVAFPGFANATLTDADWQMKVSGDITDVAGNHFVGTEFDFFFLNGDINRDRRVNVNDFTILASNFGQSNRNFSHGDFNHDGIVNVNDFTILASRFGTIL